MLAVAERESSFRPLPSPSPSPSYEMPLRHLAKDPAKGGEKHVVSKTPFQNSINHQLVRTFIICISSLLGGSPMLRRRLFRFLILS